MNQDDTGARTELSRRRFLQGTAFAGFAAFVAACSSSGSSAAPAASGATSAPAASAPPASAAASTEASASAAAQTATGPLNFANWDAYIDLTTVPGPDGKLGTDDDDYDLPSPTLDDFTKKYGVEVNYKNAAIDENETFIGTIRPQLEAGADTGWDLIVLTDWMAKKLV